MVIVLLRRLSGLVPHRIEGGRSCLTVVVFRAVIGRSARLSRLRAVAPTTNAVEEGVNESVWLAPCGHGQG